MGYSSQRQNILLFLGAFEKVLLDQGFNVPSGAGVGAAVQVLPPIAARRSKRRQISSRYSACEIIRRSERAAPSNVGPVLYAGPGEMQFQGSIPARREFYLMRSGVGLKYVVIRMRRQIP